MLQTAGAPLGVTQSKQEKLNKVLFGADKSKYFGPSDREYLDFLDQFFPSNVANYTREKLYNGLLNVPVLRDYLIQRGQPRSGPFLDDKTLGDGVTIRSLLDDGINEMRSQQYRDTSATDKAILASDYLPKTKVPITSKYAPVQITKNADQTAARIADRLDIDAPSLRDSIAIKLRSFESPDEAKRYLDNLLGEDGYVAPEFFTEMIKEGVPLSQANRLVFNVIKTGRVLLDKRDFLYQEEFSQAFNEYDKAREAFERADIKPLFDGVKHSRPLRKLEEDYDTAMQIIDQITANLAAIKQYGNELPLLADVKNMEDTRLEEMRRIAEARRERMELARQEREAEEKERLEKIALENEKLHREKEESLKLAALKAESKIDTSVENGDKSKSIANKELLKHNFDTIIQEILNDYQNPTPAIDFNDRDGEIRKIRQEFVFSATQPPDMQDRAYICDIITAEKMNVLDEKIARLMNDPAILNWVTSDAQGSEYNNKAFEFLSELRANDKTWTYKYFESNIAEYPKVKHSNVTDLEKYYPHIGKTLENAFRLIPLNYTDKGPITFADPKGEPSPLDRYLNLSMGHEYPKDPVRWMYDIYLHSDKVDKQGAKFGDAMVKLVNGLHKDDKTKTPLYFADKFIDTMKGADYQEFHQFIPQAEQIRKRWVPASPPAAPATTSGLTYNPIYKQAAAETIKALNQNSRIYLDGFIETHLFSKVLPIKSAEELVDYLFNMVEFTTEIVTWASAQALPKQYGPAILSCTQFFNTAKRNPKNIGMTTFYPKNLPIFDPSDYVKLDKLDSFLPGLKEEIIKSNDAAIAASTVPAPATTSAPVSPTTSAPASSAASTRSASPAAPATTSPGHVSPAGPASPRSASPAASTPVILTFDEQITRLNQIINNALEQSKDKRFITFNLLIADENMQHRLGSIDPEIIKRIGVKIENLDSRKKGSIKADERYEITKVVSDYKAKTEKEAADKAAKEAAADKAAKEAADKAAAEKAAAEKAAAEKEAADKLKAEKLAQAISLIENSFGSAVGERIKTFDSLNKDKLDADGINYIRNEVEKIDDEADQTKVDEAKSELLKVITASYKSASGVIKPRRKPAAKPAAKSAAKPAAKPAAKKQPKAAPKKSAKLFN